MFQVFHPPGAQSAPSPSDTTTRHWDISTFDTSPGSTGILSTLVDALSSSMSTPQHQRRSSSGLTVDTLDTPSVTPVTPVHTIRRSSEAVSHVLRELRSDLSATAQSDSDAELQKL